MGGSNAKETKRGSKREKADMEKKKKGNVGVKAP